MALGDRIAVFNQGELQQIDTPFNIYNGSKNEFVADFVGESTILEGTLDGNSFDGDGLKIANLNFKSPSNTSTKILIRPENFSLLAHNQSCGFVTITNILFAGDCVDVQANTATGKAIKIKESVKLLSLLQIGDSKELFVAPEYIGQVV
jgi:ABC-type Fe3+/spermidine/putrescine transport system ATPase subunit